MTEMDTGLKLDLVSKKYADKGSVWAVKDFSLEVAPGSFVCLVGPSGCGKSTVLKLVAGIEEATSGSVRNLGRVSMVFQNGALLPWLTCLGNVEFGLKVRGTEAGKAREQAKEYLKMMGLGGFERTYPRQLSGGQRQRVGIARALATQPEVLLMDEPLSALDTLTVDGLHQDLLAIWKQFNMTILMVSHSLDEAVFLSDEIVIMAGGQLKKNILVNLPHPRLERDANFLKELDKVKSAFKHLT